MSEILNPVEARTAALEVGRDTDIHEPHAAAFGALVVMYAELYRKFIAKTKETPCTT